jgi:hypothetical protein
MRAVSFSFAAGVNLHIPQSSTAVSLRDFNAVSMDLSIGRSSEKGIELHFGGSIGGDCSTGGSR